jgi:F-type H+-transporting ATPase subunit b
MEIIMPEIGVIFWTFLSFLVVFFVLRKFAWKPIISMLNERDQSIEQALTSADTARKEMQKLELKNEELVKEAKLEREALLKEAKDTQIKIISEARESAKDEANKMIEKARKEISAERETAFAEMKNEIVSYAVEIAEKILRQELQDKDKQKLVAEKYLDDIKKN